MSKVVKPVLLSDAERAMLESWSQARTAPFRLVLRSRIVLLLAEGHSGRKIAEQLHVSRNTVDLWRARFNAGGCAGIRKDRPGRGRKPASAKFAGESGPDNFEREMAADRAHVECRSPGIPEPELRPSPDRTLRLAPDAGRLQD